MTNTQSHRFIRNIHVIFLIGCLVLNVVSFYQWYLQGRIGGGSFTSGVLVAGILCCMVQTIAIGSALLYFLSGYKKNAAVFYKSFIFITVLCLIAMITGHLFLPNHSLLPVFLHAQAAACILVLGIVKDLGRKKSCYLFCVILACTVVTSVLTFMSANNYGSLNFCLICSAISHMLIIGTMGIMITAKFIDKAARGTV